MVTDNYREDEIQALIVFAELEYPVDSPNNNSYKSFPENIDEARSYFRSFRTDLSSAYKNLRTQNLISPHGDFWKLTPEGKEIAEQVRKSRPPIYYWYREYHTAVENSAAFDEFSQRIFGENLGQHDFSDVPQLQMMLGKVRIKENYSVLDIGCGNGKIAEYISDITGAHITGIDYIPEAINTARKRTSPKSDRLRFQIGDIENPVKAGTSFDLILSIDSVYFSDANTVLEAWKKLLKPDGQMAIFFLSLDGNDISDSLMKNGLPYDVYDLSREHWAHMQRKHVVVKEMKEKFESEGNLFVWENLMLESVSDHYPYDPEKTSMRRYLYIVKL
ncbi:MAG: methyltransferase domain-containing protein [Dehalococcoidales bacterium]|nr:MAG: methyltransferase domain-containing protein [Dehalococcoidales bacterium]